MRNTLGTRLLITFFLAGLLVSVTLMVFELQRANRQFDARNSRDLITIEETVVPPMTDSLWSYDLELAGLLASGVLHFNSVIAVEVDHQDQTLFFRKYSETDESAGDDVGTKITEYPLVKSRGEEQYDVGVLRIFQRHGRNAPEVLKDFQNNILVGLIQVLVHSLILVLILSRYITRPLRRLARIITESGKHPGRALPLGQTADWKLPREMLSIRNAAVASFEKLQSEIQERTEAESRLKALLGEKDVLLKEVHHRVKNNLQVIIGLLSLQQIAVHDEKAAEILTASKSRIYSMAMVHKLIYNAEELHTLSLETYLEQLGKYLFKVYCSNSDIDFRLSRTGPSPDVPIEVAIPCGLILNELITNACKHAFTCGNPGRIELHLETVENRISITVSDNGVGFSPVSGTENRHASDFNSIGMNIIFDLCRQLDGEGAYLPSEQGTVFRFAFPVPRTGEAAVL